MAGSYRSGRMSENDMLIEMRRLRRELGPIRDRMGPGRRSSSFETGRLTSGQLRARVGAAMLAALLLMTGTVCFLLYRLLASTAGTFFNDLLPHPARHIVHATFRALAQILLP